MAGSTPSPEKFLAERWRRGACAGVALLAVLSGTVDCALAEAALRPYMIVGDAIPASLTGSSGDPVRGREIVVNRQVGLCLLCHSGPFPEQKFQGTLAPDLKGAGARSSEGQLRLRIVDASKIKPDTIMPPYYRWSRAGGALVSRQAYPHCRADRGCDSVSGDAARIRA
jgi:sulfur-oxidizing protein SoxX